MFFIHQYMPTILASVEHHRLKLLLQIACKDIAMEDHEDFKFSVKQCNCLINEISRVLKQGITMFDKNDLAIILESLCEYSDNLAVEILNQKVLGRSYQSRKDDLEKCLIIIDNIKVNLNKRT